MRQRQLLGLMLAVCTTGSAWAAGGIAGIVVEPNRATVRIELPGNVTADLELRFEQSVGLTADSLGVSARLANPSDLAGRLPTSVSVPLAFPVLIAIEPPASAALSFSGVVAIDLHTHALNYVAGSPLRLLAAESGGSFRDLTANAGVGSYRAGANKGGFSEFLIAADVRPLGTVIDEKFNRVQAQLDGNAGAIAPSVLASLRTQIRAARTAYDAGNATTAAERVDQFVETVRQNSGAAIPDVWRSARDVVNVAGQLRSEAATLKFSLLLKASGS